MYVVFVTRSGQTHRILLNLADFSLADLVGFEVYIMFFQFCFQSSGDIWLPKVWWYSWCYKLQFSLAMEADVLPYRYGYGGDFSGGASFTIDGEPWAINVGPGECSLTQAIPYENRLNDRVAQAGSRRTGWIDLRGKKECRVDGRTIRIQRKKQTYRWYEELPGLMKFLESLPKDAELRAYSYERNPSIAQLLKFAAEEPGGMDGAIQVLQAQGEKGLSKLRNAMKNQKLATYQPLIQTLIALAFPDEINE